jgi:hypothetical protein
MNTPIWVDWCVTISFGVWNEPSDNLTPNLNGQRVLTPDQWWVMMSFLMSFFWCSKVMQMLSARWRVWLACEICLLPLKNLMFLIHCVFSWPEFLRYLQECIVKKKAPKNSLHRISSFFIWRSCETLSLQLPLWERLVYHLHDIFEVGIVEWMQVVYPGWGWGLLGQPTCRSVPCNPTWLWQFLTWWVNDVLDY